MIRQKPDGRKRNKADENAAYMPSPEEIADATRRLQSTWTDEERERRAGIVREPFVIPGAERALGDGLAAVESD
jgi:hypothetical protein